MATILRARSTPYRPTLKACERVCTRCGIVFRVNTGRARPPLTECRDCR